jgi:predicted transport protein
MWPCFSQREYDFTAEIYTEEGGNLFTKVLDRTVLGTDDEDAGTPTDRKFWEAQASPATVGLADQILTMIQQSDPQVELKYNKFYIGLAKGGQPNNFVIFRPKKDWLRLEVRLERSDETQAQLDGSGLDVMDYDSRWGRYRIRLAKGDMARHKDFLAELMKKAFGASA